MIKLSANLVFRVKIDRLKDIGLLSIFLTPEYEKIPKQFHSEIPSLCEFPGGGDSKDRVPAFVLHAWTHQDFYKQAEKLKDGDYVNVETDDISSILVDKAGAIDISHRLKKLSVYKG